MHYKTHVEYEIGHTNMLLVVKRYMSIRLVSKKKRVQVDKIYNLLRQLCTREYNSADVLARRHDSFKKTAKFNDTENFKTFRLRFFN